MPNDIQSSSAVAQPGAPLPPLLLPVPGGGTGGAVVVGYSLDAAPVERRCCGGGNGGRSGGAEESARRTCWFHCFIAATRIDSIFDLAGDWRGEDVREKGLK